MIRREASLTLVTAPVESGPSRRRRHVPRKARARKNHGGEASWAVSYVDLLTLLLCFFIIFYNSKVNQTESARNLTLEKMAESIGAKGVVGLAPSVSPTDVLREVPGTKVTRSGDRVSVEFDRTSFFPSLSKKLTNEGQTVLEEVARRLLPFRDSIRVTVQGHTDQRKVVSKVVNLADNWELSVLRATQALKVFRNAGFSENSLSAEGLAPSELDSEVPLEFQRRVTLHIEVVK